MHSTCSSERRRRRGLRLVGGAGRSALTRAHAMVSRDSGYATAELALALPALVMVVSLVLTVVGVASDASRASDAARSAARAVSIGTHVDTATAQAQRLAPARSSVRIEVEGPWVSVEVAAPSRRWGPLPLPAPVVSAAALLEPGVAP